MWSQVSANEKCQVANIIRDTRIVGEKYGDLAELEAIFIWLGRVTFIVDGNTGVEASSGKFGKEWMTFRAACSRCTCNQG